MRRLHKPAPQHATARSRRDLSQIVCLFMHGHLVHTCLWSCPCLLAGHSGPLHQMLLAPPLQVPGHYTALRSAGLPCPWPLQLLRCSDQAALAPLLQLLRSSSPLPRPARRLRQTCGPCLLVIDLHNNNEREVEALSGVRWANIELQGHKLRWLLHTRPTNTSMTASCILIRTHLS